MIKILLLLFFPVFFLFGQNVKEAKTGLKSSIFEPYNDIESKLENWSLEDVEKYATANNPLYLAEKQNIGMSRGDLITASLYKNPVFNYQQQFIPLGDRGFTGNFLYPQGSTGGPVEYAPSITQDIDVSGIVRQRTKVAQQAFHAQIAAFADFDRIFRLRLRQNYWLHLYMTELVNFQKEFFENYNDLLELNKFRADKGDIAPLEYDRLQLERIRIEKDLKDADIMRAQVAKELRFLIGIAPSSKVLEMKGRLAFKTMEEMGISVTEFNVEDRPDIQALKLKVVQSKLNIELKEKEGSPFSTLNLGGEYRHKGSESYAGIFVTVPIKIIDRNQGEILKAEESYKKTTLELESKYRQVYAEIRASLRELQAREELLLSYRSIKLVEKNKEVQEKYRLAYIRGASNLVTFLEAEKNYLTVLRGYYEQLYLYYNAIEQFRAAIGKLGNINE